MKTPFCSHCGSASVIFTGEIYFSPRLDSYQIRPDTLQPLYCKRCKGPTGKVPEYSELDVNYWKVPVFYHSDKGLQTQRLGATLNEDRENLPLITCPLCKKGHTLSTILDDLPEYIEEFHKCKNCGHEFKTIIYLA